MKRGEIWTVAGGGACASKPRPAVIVQDDGFDGINSVTMCPLTSELVEIPLLRISIEPSAENGLRSPSHVVIDKIMTAPRAKVTKRAGALTAAQMLQIERSLLVFLGIAR